MPMQSDIEDCVLAVALVWITLAMLPQATSKRWATGTFSFTRVVHEEHYKSL